MSKKNKDFTNKGDRKTLESLIVKGLILLIGVMLVVFLVSVILQNSKKAKNNAYFEKAEQHIQLREYDEARKTLGEVQTKVGNTLQLKTVMRRLNRVEGITNQSDKIQNAIYQYNWEEARGALEELREIDPHNKLLESVPERIETLEKERLLFTLKKELEAAQEQSDWFSIHAVSKQLVENSDKDHHNFQKWQSIYQEADVKMESRRKKAMELFQQAKDADTGEYNEEAIKLITEARDQYASDYIELLYLKLSSYPRNIKVPDEVATIQEAVLQANRNDTITLSAGSYNERIVIDKKIKLSAQLGAEVTVSCSPQEGSVLFVSSAGELLCSGITFKHDVQLRDDNEFAVVHIEGDARFNEVRVSNGSGHGVVVTNGGELFATESVFSKNRWSGVAMFDSAKVDLFQTELVSNSGNGIDLWGEQTHLSVDEVLVSANTQSGLFCGEGTGTLSVQSSEFSFNKEIGIYLTSKQSGLIKGVKVHDNELGGVFVKSLAEAVSLEESEVKQNGYAGIILVEGARMKRMGSNEISENKGSVEIWYKVDKKPEKVVEVVAEKEFTEDYGNLDTTTIPKAILIEE